MNKAVSMPKMDPGEREYRAEDDHRTLRRAAEVRSDPLRMRDVQSFHRKTLREMGEVGRELKSRGKRRVAKRSMPSGR